MSPTAAIERTDAPAPVRTEAPGGVAITTYAHAAECLERFVGAADAVRRAQAMQQSIELMIIHETVEFAVRNATAFTSPRLSHQRQRELARRSVVAELATGLRVAERTMQRRIDDAYALNVTLPHTMAAFQAGDIDFTHARIVIDATSDLADDPETRDRMDRELADRAREMNPPRLRRLARRLREEIQAGTLAERFARAHAERRVELEPAADGMAWLHLFLDASDALLIADRLHRLADASADADASSPIPAMHVACASTSAPDDASGLVPDGRTPAQLRADAARDLLLYGTAEGDDVGGLAGEIRPSVHVTVPVLTLLGHREDAGTLEGYGPIAPDTARRLAAHAPSFTRLLTHPVSGVVLDLDRTVYRPPADLVKWLRVRDETCRFPGCNRRAAGCDIDHSDDYADGGKTAFDNLAHLCRAHHTLKHQTSWHLDHRPDGVLEWRSPGGRTHTTSPAASIRHRPLEPPPRTRALPPPQATATTLASRRPDHELPEEPPW